LFMVVAASRLCFMMLLIISVVELFGWFSVLY